MKKLIYILIITFLSSNAYSSMPMPTPDFEKIFADKNACFVLYDLHENKIVTSYNKKHCLERLSPCSTFKIPLALMAFDTGILQDEKTVIKWDGIKRELPAWNEDQTPKSWLSDSTVWVSQWLTPQIGMHPIKKYLVHFSYGNQDMSGGITEAWLSSSLKISAYEQIRFLKKFWQNKLPVSENAVKLTKKILPVETDANGNTLYGKTGSGFLEGHNVPNDHMIGWYVGALTHNGDEYVFVTNTTDTKPNTSEETVSKTITAGEAAKAATKEILETLRLWTSTKIE
jgi:beta-lactamase class D